MQTSDKKQLKPGKTVAIIQARMGSTRLNGKIMRDLCGKPVLWHVIERVMQAKEIDDIVIATTMLPGDDVITEFCDYYMVNWYRGSESDVLARYYHAARENQAETIVRITSDCPLYDPRIGDSIIRYFHSNSYSIVTNAGGVDSQRTFPPGTDTEVFSMACLSDAFKNATKPYQREHVTPYIYEKQKENVYHHDYEKDCSHIRLTLDTQEDYTVISKIYDHLYQKNKIFYLEDILHLYRIHPDIFLYNQNVRQKPYYETAISSNETIS